MAARGERPTRKTQPPRNGSHDASPRDQHGPTKPAPPVGPALQSTHTMKQALTSDWGPTLYLWTAQLAEIVVAVYVSGLMLGAWLHRLNVSIARMVAS